MHSIEQFAQEAIKLLEQSIALTEHVYPVLKPKPRGRHARRAPDAPPKAAAPRRYAFQRPLGKPANPPRPPREPGGQAGNLNAMKHGVFTRIARFERARAKIARSEFAALGRRVRRLRYRIEDLLPKDQLPKDHL